MKLLTVLAACKRTHRRLPPHSGAAADRKRSAYEASRAAGRSTYGYAGGVNTDWSTHGGASYQAQSGYTSRLSERSAARAHLCMHRRRPRPQCCAPLLCSCAALATPVPQPCQKASVSRIPWTGETPLLPTPRPLGVFAARGQAGHAVV